MSKIKIRNFGPIKEGYQENGGWIDIKKVTIFIGNQGSGKSTVAKLISTFMWLEKALIRGDIKAPLSYVITSYSIHYTKLYYLYMLERPDRTRYVHAPSKRSEKNPKSYNFV